MNQVQNILHQLRGVMSQAEIARRTGITQPKLSRWEAGHIASGAEDALKLAALAEEIKRSANESEARQRAQGAIHG